MLAHKHRQQQHHTDLPSPASLLSQTPERKHLSGETPQGDWSRLEQSRGSRAEGAEKAEEEQMEQMEQMRQRNLPQCFKDTDTDTDTDYLQLQ